MEICCQHISVNCRQKSNIIKFLDQQTLVFAFHDQIGFYSITKNKILFTIHDQLTSQSLINCISAISNHQSKFIFCGYDSGLVIAYQQKHDQKWSKVWNIQDKSGIISIETVKDGQRCHIFTINYNSILKHYILYKSTLSFIEELIFPANKMILTISITIQQKYLMLFVGGVDQKIHYYQKQTNQQISKFIYQFSLAGHEDAITKLIISNDSQSQDLFLASSSKDGYIRVWKITQNKQQIQCHNNVQLILKKKKIFLQSVLISHQSSITSLEWSFFGNNLKLISSSLDSTICIWERGLDQAWIVQSRMGQLIGNKNAYFDVISDPKNSYLAALNYTGALLIWKWKDSKFSLRQSFNGHSSQVCSLQWNHTGHFLVTVSSDQTTRIIAKNIQSNVYNQISRAQIHGYDINAVTTIKVKEKTIDLIVCGADQKVIRILEPPACFANYLNTFTQANLHLYFNSEQQQARYKISKNDDKILLYTAYSQGGAQVLGLMTKMQRQERQKITTYFDDQQGGAEQIDDRQNQAVQTIASDYSIPPHEDYLIKHTLWPEINKLYGHPHQIQNLCRSNDSKKIASTCKALNKQSASVIIWDTENWKIYTILSHHKYTVYAIQFSPFDNYFASVSKDRHLAVYTREFKLLYFYQAHLRAITCLSFHCSQNYILTGSRDKTLKLHSVQSKKIISQKQFETPVTSIAFCRMKQYQNYFAIGFVNGVIQIGIIVNQQINILSSVSDIYSHSQSVNCLKWSNNILASGSKDSSVRIFELKFPKS